MTDYMSIFQIPIMTTYMIPYSIVIDFYTAFVWHTASSKPNLT